MLSILVEVPEEGLVEVVGKVATFGFYVCWDF